MRRVCASYSGADARTKDLKNVKIVIKNRVSEEFRKEVESALDSFPSYYNLLETTIALGAYKIFSPIFAVIGAILL